MSASSSVRNLKCSEIWGGIQAAESTASVPGIDAWVICKPHMGAAGGGDIYYVGLCGRGMRSRFVVADVSGHGDVVASYATRLHDMMEEQMNTLDQSQLVKALNEGFPSLVSSEHFATAVIMSYTPMARHMVVVNAGHPRPLWYSRRDNGWRILSHDVPQGADKLLDLPLGVIPEAGYVQFAIPLALGDIILLFTDCLVEAKNDTGRALGEAGLLELARKMDVSKPGRLGRALVDGVCQYHGGRPFDDDVTMLTLHRGANPPMMGAMASMAGEAMKGWLGRTARRIFSVPPP